MKNKKAFSFVELIIVLTIIVLISVVVFKVSSESKEKTTNAKVESDIISISNSLKANFEQEKKLSLPSWNRNYFKSNWAYSHETFEDENSAFWVYWKISSKNLEKKYLSEVPKDIRTWEFYSYWILNDKKTFEVASFIKKDWKNLAKVVWNYSWDKWVLGLIREYNWPYFIVDGSENLPYNPDKIILSATDSGKNEFLDWDKIAFDGTNLTKNGEKITNPKRKKIWEKYFYDLYFSDWSIWKIELENENDEFSLTLWWENKNLVLENNWEKSKIAMFLEAWKMWIFASNYEDSKSELEVWTQDLTAAVRWTIFTVDSKISKNEDKVVVYKWNVQISIKWDPFTEAKKWKEEEIPLNQEIKKEEKIYDNNIVKQKISLDKDFNKEELESAKVIKEKLPEDLKNKKLVTFEYDYDSSCKDDNWNTIEICKEENLAKIMKGFSKKNEKNNEIQICNSITDTNSGNCDFLISFWFKWPLKQPLEIENFIKFIHEEEYNKILYNNIKNKTKNHNIINKPENHNIINDELENKDYRIIYKFISDGESKYRVYYYIIDEEKSDIIIKWYFDIYNDVKTILNDLKTGEIKIKIKSNNNIKNLNIYKKDKKKWFIKNHFFLSSIYNKLKFFYYSSLIIKCTSKNIWSFVFNYSTNYT